MPDQLDRLKTALAGRYEIERELGAGGMATVYLARDVRHDRRVAVKVLRAELAASLGADRFLREVRIAANLTHPHILPVHDSGEADGFLYYVMPFIDGESLRARIDREGALPVPDAARILRDVTDALAAAHAQRIVHRDIKPDNVLLSGRHALVADFGVAKAVSEATGRHEMTTVGVALGTPSYMAPEQASGSPTIDHRADLYAVGAMAYEMLTGKPPFTGPSAQQVLSAHLTATPTAITLKRPNLPPAMAGLVMRCLEKNPADRVQTAAEMAPTFEALSASTSTMTPAATTAVPAVAARDGTPKWMFGALAGAVVLVGAFAVWMLRPSPAAPALSLGQRSQATRETTVELDPALSPNGQFLAYSAGTLGDAFKVYVRQIDGGSPIAVAPDLPGDQRFPSWSSDGGQVVFRSARGVEIVPATGGVSRRLGSRSAIDRVAWSPDGREIAMVSPTAGRVATDADGNMAIWVVPREGTDESGREVLRDDQIHSLAWSPDGRWIAYVRGNGVSIGTPGNIAPSEIWVVLAAGGPSVQVTSSGGFNASPAWLDSTLLFVSDRDGGRDIYAVDLTAGGAAAAPPRAVTTGLNTLSISVAANVSRLAFSVFLDRSNVWSMPIPAPDPGSTLDAAPLTSGNQIVEQFAVSPDGRWLAFDSSRAGNQDIYKKAIDGGPVEPLTTDPGDDFAPNWSPDQSEIAFYSYRNGIPRQLMTMPSDGGSATPIAQGELSHPKWSPDGTTLLVRQRPDNSIVLIRRTNGTWANPETLLAGVTLSSYMCWSPDGQFIAFTSPRGLETVSVATKQRTLVMDTAALGLATEPFYPQWSSDGRWIYYLDATTSGIYAVAPAGGESHLVVRFDPARPWHRYGFQATADRFYFTLGEVESDLWVAPIGR